ncbi:MAG: 50S ribosomal protein L18 [bacterium]
MKDKHKVKRLKKARKKLGARKKITGTAQRPRLIVFRSSKNIYAQLFDDVKGQALTGVSTLTPDLQDSVVKAANKTEASKVVGKAIADKAKSLKVKAVVFDRNGYLYHGRVKAVAEGARENGLKF